MLSYEGRERKKHILREAQCECVCERERERKREREGGREENLK